MTLEKRFGKLLAKVLADKHNNAMVIDGRDTLSGKSGVSFHDRDTFDTVQVHSMDDYNEHMSKKTGAQRVYSEDHECIECGRTFRAVHPAEALCQDHAYSAD